MSLRFVVLVSVVVFFSLAALGETSESRTSSVKLSVGTEVYFFNYNDKINDFETTGRQYKLDYKYSPVHTTNVSATVDLFRYVTLSGTYGSGALSFTQNEKKSTQPPADAPSWMKNSDTSLYALSLQVLGFKFFASHYQFNAGKVNIIDVSQDPEGREGPVSGSFKNNMEFRDIEMAYNIGNLYQYFFEKTENKYIEYLLLPLHFSYIVSEATLPVIPYFFYKEGGQLYFEEGKIQQAVVKNSMAGIGWSWKYADLFSYFGKSNILLTDQNNIKRELRTDGWINKFRLKYEWESSGETTKWTVNPYGQMTHYDFNDPKVGKFNTLGGEFFIYQIGVNVGVKL